MKIGIVSGEASGDILGAGLIHALKAYYPQGHFSGIGGERMLIEGFTSLYPQDRLAVMGLVEPLKRLPELLRIRKRLFNYFKEGEFDIVIGIDSPDFNLSLEKKLRQSGIKTVHYVSPSVWAWRQGRIKLIKQAVDLMLTLLPFEADFYRKHQVPVVFIGHPLADHFPLEPDEKTAKNELSVLLKQPIEGACVLAVLPGSRHGEVALIGPTMWQSVQQLCASRPDIQVIVPALNSARRQQIEEQLKGYTHLPIHITNGHSQTVISAADCVLMASGTTTLEAMLLKKPMVVVYKKAALSYAIISRLLKVPYISLPNLLANQPLVPELLQKDATPNTISDSVKHWLGNPSHVESLKKQFSEIHPQLRQGGNKKAAESIVQLLETP